MGEPPGGSGHHLALVYYRDGQLSCIGNEAEQREHRREREENKGGALWRKGKHTTSTLTVGRKP